ncbi:polysaccharide biosynthesis protein CapD [Jeotgalibacillus malaysiensis]|uniref:Polysaccharide biosynthesis protein CapD n=1 Tax=Jeotgalibacillus malaysiensis TaxID=1508404 RepID=A0A0B5AXH2_9BACL|nr:nucleoside-diphosphate sugar epimerase/dehydratase [Jeotgalibacillus malaysiensis]AJD92719.1 polysaccharide biosynthesis protein CapD [Jeotgalibacillus malaysiensis]
MSYKYRLSLFILIDTSIVCMAIFFSSFLVNASIEVFTFPIILMAGVLVTSHLLFSFRYHLYKKAWEYASISELAAICKTVFLSMIVLVITQQLVLGEVAFRLLAVTLLLMLFFIGGSRFAWRLFRDRVISQRVNKKRTLIIGAGSAGTMIARQLKHNRDCDMLPVAFIDDNVRKQQLDIMDIPVAGRVEDIEKTVSEYRIDNIIIAIPSLSKKQLNRIFQECSKTDADTKILPMIEDLVSGKVSVHEARDVQVEDLLGREPVELDLKQISEKLKHKTVLVTGAGGSIGSEIVRQVSRFEPKTIVLLGHGENSIYKIHMELQPLLKDSEIQLHAEIADIQDYKKMVTVMSEYQPDIIYHAAAHKHVPLMEQNPEEAIKNNLIGTKNVAMAAHQAGVQTFIMVSTDKAVNPTSVMGATKRLSEMVVQYMNQVSETTFAAVRFGNVLGSRGSVIPHFKRQIEQGGPITVTHPDMVRYFMTIPEASRLVIQAGALAKGGEIFVLDMGEPVKIVDLARNMIKLSGYQYEEIGIEFIGMRPGEKLYEELLNEAEVSQEQVYPKIYIGNTSSLYMDEINQLTEAYDKMNADQIREFVLELANRREKIIKITG